MRKLHAPGHHQCLTYPYQADRKLFEIDAGDLARLAQAAGPHLVRLERAFLKYVKGADPRGKSDPRRVKALSLITSGALVRLLEAGRTAADFFEQVAYNSRRLAKLNVSPAEILDAFREYDRELDALLEVRPGAEALGPIRQAVRCGCLLTINDSYYQVRETETQAFYGLLQAEMDARGLEDLLRRFIAILTRTFRAQSGRLFPFGEEQPLGASQFKALAKPRYIAGGKAAKLILDPSMRGNTSLTGQSRILQGSGWQG